MTLDLAVAALALLGALLGAIKGAARQVAQLLALLAAWMAASPIGDFFGEVVAAQLGSPLLLGVVLATSGSFLAIWFVVQLLATRVLGFVLSGGKEDRLGVDRALGSVLGALKVLLFAWVGLCTATFIENKVTVFGKALQLTPPGSQLVRFCREVNLFDLQQFSGLNDLVKVAKVASQPQAAQKLKGDVDFSALLRDPRFKKALEAEAMKKAIETGDARPLLSSDAVLALIRDSAAMRRIERLAERP